MIALTPDCARRKFMLGRVAVSRYKKAAINRVILARLGCQSARVLHERRIPKRMAEMRKNRRCLEPRLKFIT